MNLSLRASRIIWYEAVAFAAIIAISWVNELSGFEGMIFEKAYGPPDWRGPILETAFIVLVGTPAILLSWRLSKRLHYLEGFLRVCAWCHRVGQGNDWISTEEFMRKTLNTETTHGICPSCSLKLKEARGQ